MKRIKTDMDKLTEYQQAQLLHKHLTGDFKFFNAKQNKVSRQAWTKMLDALINADFIDTKSVGITPSGKVYCNAGLTIPLKPVYSAQNRPFAQRSPRQACQPLC